MEIHYSEQSGKGFKAKLKVREEELEKYLESWYHDEDLLGFLFTNVIVQMTNMLFGV